MFVNDAQQNGSTYCSISIERCTSDDKLNLAVSSTENKNGKIDLKSYVSTLKRYFKSKRYFF